MVYWPTKEEWGMLYYGGPLAIIFTRKNITKAKKIHEMRRWFVNELGIFERDSETEYRHGKQLISFYNSHGQTLDKNAVKKIEKLYVLEKDKELTEYLYELYPKVKAKLEENKIEIKTIYDLMHEIAVETKHEAIDIDTDKFMPTLRAYNPKAIKQLIEKYREAKKETEMLSPLIPKQVMPAVYVFAIVIIALAAFQNLPDWAERLVEFLQSKGYMKFLLFGSP